MDSSFLHIEMGRALHGDCLFVEWSGPATKHRMLIDGGPIGAYDALAARLAALPQDERAFELIVLTHVDTDHIEGLVRLLAEPRSDWPFSVKDVWFNSWNHMDPQRLLGGRQGEFVGALLTNRLDAGTWNEEFEGDAVVVPTDGPLPLARLAGGMTLTLLSPTSSKLAKMRQAWIRDLRQTGIKPGDVDAAWQELAGQKKYLPEIGLLGSSDSDIAVLLNRQFRSDPSAANGASIAFLAEHPAGSCLFLADAHADAVIESLRRLLQDRNVDRLRVDAVKVAHHGSKNNTNEELLGLIDSRRFLFSTSGAQFQHPDEETIAGVLAAAAGKPLKLYFNYRSAFNEKWADPDLQERWNFEAVYGSSEGGPLVVELAS